MKLRAAEPAIEGSMKPKIIITAGCYAIAVIASASMYCRLEKGGCDCPPSKFEHGTYYSEDYEDYILGYVFKDVKKGFYIDVGANDPNTDNVTRYFYERGWNGINIEPNVDLFRKIVSSRPRDSNYNVGISNNEGAMTFYKQTDSGSAGLSTFNKEISEREKKENGVHFTEISVPITTLDKIIARVSPPEITFITIDVEGFEKQVVESIDLVKYKPTVFCIEAVQPLTEMPSYQSWEKMLTDNNYVFAMFDGVNRFYVHNSHSDLQPRFAAIDKCVKKSKEKRQRKKWLRKLLKRVTLVRR